MKTADEKKPENSLKKTNLQTDRHNSEKVRVKTTNDPPSDNDQLEPHWKIPPIKARGRQVKICSSFSPAVRSVLTPFYDITGRAQCPSVDYSLKHSYSPFRGPGG